MEETEAYTEVSAQDSTTAENAGAQPALGALFTGLLAMALIYVFTVFLPKIAAWLDKLLGRDTAPQEPPEPCEYKVNDIYEGEKCLDDNNDDKEQ